MYIDKSFYAGSIIFRLHWLQQPTNNNNATSTDWRAQFYSQKSFFSPISEIIHRLNDMSLIVTLPARNRFVYWDYKKKSKWDETQPSLYYMVVLRSFNVPLSILILLTISKKEKKRKKKEKNDQSGTWAFPSSRSIRAAGLAGWRSIRVILSWDLSSLKKKKECIARPSGYIKASSWVLASIWYRLV